MSYVTRKQWRIISAEMYCGIKFKKKKTKKQNEECYK